MKTFTSLVDGTVAFSAHRIRIARRGYFLTKALEISKIFDGVFNKRTFGREKTVTCRLKASDKCNVFGKFPTLSIVAIAPSLCY